LLLEPGYFAGLSRNGFAAGTTLYSEPDEYKEILRKLDAVCKTGTVSDAGGRPIAGHLMAAWPAQSPVLLAVFRTIGGSGASNLKRASKILERWSVSFPAEYAKVRVSVMTLTPRNTWDIFNDCPSFDLKDAGGWKKRISTCGHFRIVSSAPGSRTERTVSGVLASSHDGLRTILETDSETYAGSVLNAEAQGLQGEAEKALRAVIVWNGVHGGSRHPETSAVCDSTHCMVFQGSPREKQKPGGKTAPALLRLLDENARKKGLEWLHFSSGGQDEWEMRMPSPQLRELADESAILDIRRERTRTGAVSVHLLYKEGEESVPCEFLRNRLKLPSCPESINYDENSTEWIFRGLGKGHGLGLSVERSETLANSGLSARQILDDAYHFGLAAP
jgi:peptidoglycan hydrolase-like amidase